MCTVSWLVHDIGYDLFFNRDESRQRIAADPPSRHQSPIGTQYLAPIDPQGGGSWIFVNQHGLTACVLNHYAADTKDTAVPTSRGQLLLALADCKSTDEVSQNLRHLFSAKPYRSCLILTLTHKSTSIHCWNGQQLTQLPNPSRNMLTTSSFKTDEVLASREKEFDILPNKTPSTLQHFHLSENSNPTACTVRMSRPDAHSVSYTHIKVADQITMAYAPRNQDAHFASPSITELHSVQ
jgi:hypothetical protein